jgi:hypothetical protein
MKKRFFRISLLSIFSLLLLKLSSCNEVPIEVPLIQDTLTLYSLSSNEVNLIEKTSIHKREIDGPFNFSSQLLGKFEEYKSHIIYRFLPPPATMGYIEEIDITSAELYLYPDAYAFGDTNSFYQEFSVFEFVDSISRFYKYSDVFDEMGNSQFLSQKVGLFAGSMKPKDSAVFKIDLDKQFIVKWFKFAEKEDSIRRIFLDPEKTLDLTVDENRYLFHSYSLALRADENSSVISRFINRTDLDTLFNTQVKIVAKKQGRDTTIFLKNAIAAFYPKTPEIVDNGNIYLQGLGQTRTVLDFNLDTIPPLSAILSCKLELTLDTNNSIFGTLGASNFIAGGSNQDPFFSPGSTQQNSWSFVANLNENKNKYIFENITPIVDGWNRNDGKGRLVLSPSRGTNSNNEFTYMDKYIFYGINHPDIEKRPKLLIIYSRRPQI